MCHLDVFHAGEIAVQERAGERAIAASRESVIRCRLNDAANGFVESQRAIAVAAAAPDGSLWASFWVGEEGFLRGNVAGDSVTVLRDLGDHESDPVRAILQPNEPFGLLVIDLETRRRLRINGRVCRADRAGVEIGIREAFGNCPKYIQKRARVDGTRASMESALEHGSVLDEERRRFISCSDTLFVASTHRERGVDVSHRGGDRGFACVVDDRTVRIPDYRGNSLFQTLGNFELDARCGIAFIDFDRQRVLSATGSAAIEFGAEAATQPTGGTGRYWVFTVDRWIEFSIPSKTRWTLVERSPFNPR